ncbi:MAG: hypothetical protein MJ058_04060 [Akkermansia sp.]|nr:hypothetical protein [Akkermansia sp.]
MKLHLPSSLRKALLAVLASTTYFSTADAACLHAAVSPTTYTDFGQNMARYSVYQVNELLTQIRANNGVQIPYTTDTPPATMGVGQPMISFESVNGDGAFTAVGYNYTATVSHNGCPNPCFTGRYVGEDQAVHYQGVEYRSSQNKVFLLSPSIDYKITRSSKIFTDITASGVFDTTQYLRDGGLVTDLVHYRAGAGTCDQADFEGNTHNLAGGYAYITGGVVATLGFSYMEKSATYEGYDYKKDYGPDEGPRDSRGVIDDPYTISIHGIQDYGPGGAGQPSEDNPKVYLLPFVSRGGDSGSPVWAWDENDREYKLISCHQARGGDNSYSRGASEWTMAAMEYFNEHVDMDQAGHTVHMGAVERQGEYKYDETNKVGTTLQYGSITGADAAFEDVSFCGVGPKEGKTIYTWLSLYDRKDVQNWYSYGNAYFNANGNGSGKDMHLGDLFYTENIVFASDGSDVNNIVLDADIDMGIGYAQFTTKEAGQKAVFNLTSGGKTDGRDYMLNSAGYIVDEGAELHIQVTNTQEDSEGNAYFREWRKQGAGDMYLEGQGDNEIFLNLGGSGTTYLREDGGYAAYNVLINNGATLNFGGDIKQIARDVTFGNGGGYLEFSGLKDFDWYSGENSDVEANGFTINALTQDATLINSQGSTTLHYKTDGETTFLGSFLDTENSSLTVIYEGGGTWTLNSIHTNLQNAGSSFIVQSGTAELVGQHTVHGIGSIEGKGGTRYTHPDDWHYSDAAMDVEVQGGATFRLGSHARLTGNVDVQSGGTLEIAEGVKHRYEYIEGWLIAEDTTSEFYRGFYGLKGNVSLAENSTLRFNFSEGTDAENVYGGQISGDGSVDMRLGGSGATLVLSGENTFTGTKNLSGGGLVAEHETSLGDTTDNKWHVKEDAFIAVKGIDGNQALTHIAGDSAGVIALTQDQTEQVDLTGTGHTGMFVGALAGQVVQYGEAPEVKGHKTVYTEDRLDPVELDGQRKWQLGGGGGELVVNFLLEDSAAELVLGNEYTTGTVTLTNIWNQIGSINFAGRVTLNYTDEEALGGSKISLGYSNRVIGSASLLKSITRSSDGVLLLDKMPEANVDLTDHHFMALGSDGDMVYSGSITPTAGSYRFGGITGTLELQTALTDGDGETRNLLVDGQGYAGGTLALATQASLTGEVVVTGHDTDRHPEFSGGDISLRLDTADAITSASRITVKEGGSIDINGTTQTFHGFNMEAGSALVDTSELWSGSAVVDVAAGATSRLEGNVDVYSLTKTGQGDMVLGGSNNYGVFFIEAGRVLLENGNALSATGTAMLESGGVLDASNVDISAAIGFAGGTLQVGTKRVAGSLAVAKGYEGTVQQNADNITTSINSGLQVAQGATLKLSGNHGNFNFSAEEINEDGGTIALEGNRIAFTNGKEMTIGGVVSLQGQGLAANERVTLYSDGSADNMIRNINELHIVDGQSAAIQEASWNTIWNIHCLTGSGDLKWVSNTTHWYSARVVLDGANSFTGQFTAERTYGNVAERCYQSFVEARHDLAMQHMDVSVIGKGAQSNMALAVNTDNLQMRSLSGNGYALLYAGAALEGADHDKDEPLKAAPESTRRATLTITGTGDHTFSGNVSGQDHYIGYETKEDGTQVKVADVTNAGISIVMDGQGKQTFNGARTRFNSVTVHSGVLELASADLTIKEDVTITRGAELQLSQAYALDSGKTLTVLANEPRTSARLSGGLALNGGTLTFSAEGLSDSAPALILDSLSGSSVTLNFTETHAFTSGVQYHLADQDWSHIHITDATEGLTYLTASYQQDANGLYVSFTTKEGNLIWGGTDDEREWSSHTFGPSGQVPTSNQTAVFNDAAPNHHVNITDNVKVAGLVFDAAGDYDLKSDNGSTVTAGSVVQSGSGTTTLTEAVRVGTDQSHGTVTVTDGELRVTDDAVLQNVDTITGGGTLGVDFGEGYTGTIGALFAEGSSVGSLRVVSGTFEAYGTPGYAGLQLDAGAGYTVDAEQSLAYMQVGQGDGGSPAMLNLGNSKLTAAMVVMQGDLAISGSGGELHADITGGHTITTSGTVTLRGSNFDGNLHVQSGTLNMFDGANTHVAGITMDAGTTLYLGISTGLEGGATIHMGNNASLRMENGAGGSHIVNANIVMDGSYASLYGTLNGNSTVVRGSIAGHGTLFLKAQSSFWNNSWSIESLLQDGEAGALALSSDGNVTLSAANTYSGGTIITGNKLTTNNERALGTGTLNMTGGELVLKKDLTVGGLSGSENATINLGTKRLTVDSTVDTRFSGEISNGSITKLGSGTLEIEVGGELDNISVGGGTLALGDSAVTGNLSVAAGTTLDFTGDMLRLSHAVDNAGTFRFSTPGTSIEIENGSGFDIHTDGYLDVNGNKAENGFAQGLTIQVFENTGDGQIEGIAPEVAYMGDTLTLDLSTGVASRGGSNSAYTVRMGTVVYDDAFAAAPGAKAVESFSLASVDPFAPATLQLSRNLDAGVRITVSGNGGNISLDRNVVLSAGDVDIMPFSYTTLHGEGTLALDSGKVVMPDQMGIAGEGEWTGTVRISNTSFKDADITGLANSTSRVEMYGITGGYLKQWQSSLDTNIRLTDTESGAYAWKWTDGKGSGASTLTFTGTWDGSGSFVVGGAGKNQNFTYKGDLSGWTGRYIQNGDTSLVTFAGTAERQVVGADFVRSNGTLNMAVGDGANATHAEIRGSLRDVSSLEVKARSTAELAGANNSIGTLTVNADAQLLNSGTTTLTGVLTNSGSITNSGTLTIGTKLTNGTIANTGTLVISSLMEGEVTDYVDALGRRTSNGNGFATTTLTVRESGATINNSGDGVILYGGVDVTNDVVTTGVITKRVNYGSYRILTTDDAVAYSTIASKAHDALEYITMASDTHLRVDDGEVPNLRTSQVKAEGTATLDLEDDTTLVVDASTAAKVAAGDTVTLQMQTDTPTTRASIGGLSGATVNVTGSGVLDLGSAQHTVTTLNITGATVYSNHSGAGGFNAHNAVNVNAGGKLQLDNVDVMGYGNGCTATITLRGTADEHAVLELGGRQTDQGTVINMKGNAEVRAMANSRVNEQRPMLDFYNGQQSINASGSNNLIAVPFRMRNSVKIEVATDGELTLAGGTYSDNRGNTITKTGEGRLVFDTLQVGYGAHNYTGTLAVNGGSVEVNADASFNVVTSKAALTVTGGTTSISTYTGSSGSTLTVREGATLVFNGNSTLASTISNSGTVSFGAGCTTLTLSGTFEHQDNVYRDIAAGTVSTDGNGLKSGGYVSVLTGGGVVEEGVAVSFNGREYALQADGRAYQAVETGTYYARKGTAVYNDAVAAETSINKVSLSNGVTLDLQAGLADGVAIDARGGTVNIGEGVVLSRERLTNSAPSSNTSLTGGGTYLMDVAQGTTLGNNVQLGDNWSGTLRLTGETEQTVDLNAVAQQGEGYAALELAGMQSALQAGTIHADLLLTDLDGGPSALTVTNSGAFTFTGDIDGSGHIVNTADDSTFVLIGGDLSNWSGGIANNGGLAVEISGMANGAALNASLSRIDSLSYTAKTQGDTFTVASLETNANGTTVAGNNGTLAVDELSGGGNLTVNGSVALSAKEYTGQRITVQDGADLLLNELQARQTVLDTRGTVRLGAELVEVNALEGSGAIESVGGDVRTLALYTAGGHTSSARIGANIDLEMHDNGTQTLTGDLSAFNGDIYMIAGTLRLQQGNDATTIGVLNMNGGAVEFRGGSTSLGAARVTSGAQAAITVADGTSVLLGRAIQNSGSLTISGCLDASALTADQMDVGFINTDGKTTDDGSGFIVRSDAVRVVRNVSGGTLNADAATVRYRQETVRMDEDGLAILESDRSVLADTYYLRDEAVYSAIVGKAVEHGGALEHVAFDAIGEASLSLDAAADSSMFSVDILSVANVELTPSGKLAMGEFAAGADGEMRISGEGTVQLSNRAALARHTSLTQDWRGTVVLTGSSSGVNLGADGGLWTTGSTVEFNNWCGTLAAGSNEVGAAVVLNGMTLDASGTDAEVVFNNTVGGTGDLVNNSGAELSLDFNGDISGWRGSLVTNSGSTVVNLNADHAQVNAAIEKDAEGNVNIYVDKGAAFNARVHADTLAIGDGGAVEIADEFSVGDIMTYGSVTVDEGASLNVSGSISDLKTPIVNNGAVSFTGAEVQNIYLDKDGEFTFSDVTYTDKDGTTTAKGNGFRTGGTATLIDMRDGSTLSGAENVIVSYRGDLYTMLDDGTFGDRNGTHTYYIHEDTVSYSDIKDVSGLVGLHLDNTLVPGGNATLNLDANLSQGLTSGIYSDGGTVNLAQGVLLKASQLHANAATFLTGAGLYDLGESIALGITLGDGWTGTVRMANVEGLSGFNLSNYAKGAGSTVAVRGLAGWLDLNTNLQGRLMLESDASEPDKAALNITAASPKTYTFAGGVTGQGDMLASYTGADASFQFRGDLSDWSGAFISSGNDANTTSINLTNTTSLVGAAIRNTSTNTAHKVNVTVDNTEQDVYLNGDLEGINTLTYNSHANGRALHIADLTTHASGTTLNFTNGQFAALVEVDSLHGSGKLTLDNTCKSDGLAHFAINGGDYSGAIIEFNAMRDGYSGGDRRVLLTIGDEHVAEHSVINTTINKSGGKPVNIGIGIAAETVRVGGLNDNIVKAQDTCVYTLVSGTPTNHTGANATGFTSDGTVRTLEIVGNGGTSKAKVGANLNITMDSAGHTQSFTGDMASFSGAIDVQAGTLNITPAAALSLHAVNVEEGAALVLRAATTTLAQTIANAGSLTIGGAFILDAMDISGTSKFADGQFSSRNGFLVGGPSIQVVQGMGTTIAEDGVTMTYKNEEGQFDAATGIFTLEGQPGTHYETFYVNASGTAESLAHAQDASGGDLSTVRLTDGTTLNMDLAGTTLNTVEVSPAASSTLHVTKSATLSAVKGLENGQTLAVTGADGGRLTMAVGADTAVAGAFEVRDGGYVVLGNSQAFGSHSNKVVIGTGGTVDVNGKADAKYVYTLDGGFLTNTGGALQDNWAQTSGLVLTDDSSIGGSTADFRILSGGFAANSVKLDGHTLTKVGTHTLGFVNTTFNEGTLRVEKGKLDFDSGKRKNNDVLNGTRIVLADAQAGTADKMIGLVHVEGSAEITAEQSAQASVQINIRDNAALSVGAEQDRNLLLSGAVSGGASTTILKEGAGSVELSGSLSGFSGSIDAQGGILNLLNQSALSVQDVVLADGATVGAYTTAAADETNEATLTISGTLAAKGADGRLNANVVMETGSAMDASATGGNGISLGSSLTIMDGGINLSKADFEAVAGLGYGDRYVLFNGVDSLTLDQTYTEAITPTMQVDAADWFHGVEPEKYYVVYDGSNVGEVAIFCATPEPATSTLSLLALAALAARRRRR